MTKPKNDDDQFSSNADEPTAMWSEDMLRDAELPRPVSVAEAQPAPQGAAEPVSHPPLRSGARRRPPIAAAPPRASMSWTVTIVLAIGLGTAVYYLVRFLKG